MTSERIKEIQSQTAYPDSISVQQALLQVWNECSQTEMSDCINCDETKPTHNICMDCVIKIGKQNQTEISDEEIEKAAKEYVLYNDQKRAWVIEGMKLYRKQLKNKV